MFSAQKNNESFELLFCDFFFANTQHCIDRRWNRVNVTGIISQARAALLWFKQHVQCERHKWTQKTCHKNRFVRSGLGFFVSCCCLKVWCPSNVIAEIDYCKILTKCDVTDQWWNRRDISVATKIQVDEWYEIFCLLFIRSSTTLHLPTGALKGCLILGAVIPCHVILASWRARAKCA